LWEGYGWGSGAGDEGDVEEGAVAGGGERWK